MAAAGIGGGATEGWDDHGHWGTGQGRETARGQSNRDCCRGSGRGGGLHRVCVGDELWGATLRLTAKAAATVTIVPCRTCVTSVPAGIHTGFVADQYGILVNGRGARVGHFVNWITVVTPSELLLDLTLVLGRGQITAHGIEPAAANRGTIAITGGTGMYQSAGGEIRFRDVSHTVVLVQVVIDQ